MAPASQRYEVVNIIGSTVDHVYITADRAAIAIPTEAHLTHDFSFTSRGMRAMQPRDGMSFTYYNRGVNSRNTRSRKVSSSSTIKSVPS